MTADSVDLEDTDEVLKYAVDRMFFPEDFLNGRSIHNAYRPIPPLSDISPLLTNNALYDRPLSLEMYPDFLDSEYLEPTLDSLIDSSDFRRICSLPTSDLPSFGNSSHSDLESDMLLVAPNSILSPQKDDIASFGSIWPDMNLGHLSEEKFMQIVDSSLDNCPASLDDILVKTPKKFNYLDFDHSYSQRPVEFDGYFNSSPCSPASSSCSDNIVTTRGTKRGRPRRKMPKCNKKIKQEVISSEDEEVDVETPCSIPLVVPKITISITPPPTPPAPAKRGRKPKVKSEGQIVKKPNNKNCPVSPKVLQAAIQQEKKRSYVTKSGRVTKIGNSVETTPSTSTPSSMSNSRSNSDNEDTVDKRASHNMAERNRRQELTNLFQQLRIKVPEIKKNLKASKVLILQSSVSHITELEDFEKQKVLVKEHLKAELENKLALVQSLRCSRGSSS